MKKCLNLILAVTLCVVTILACGCASTIPCKADLLKMENLHTPSGLTIGLHDDVTVVESVAQLLAVGVDASCYSDEFFAKNVLVFVSFRHTSSEKNVKFCYLSVENGKICPVFSLDGVAQGQPATEDVLYNVFLLEVQRSHLQNKTFGEILVKNNNDKQGGSYFYNSAL